MKHNNVRQVLFPILAALIWGTAFVAQDLCADVIDTFSFNAARSYIAVVVLLHLWKRQMLLSIAAGTVCDMLLVQLVF